jgi:CcmD family protein
MIHATQSTNPATTEATGVTAKAAASGEPTDRSTAFQPVEGGTETHNGSTLMVEAYAVIWTILMVWLVLLWRKQNTINQRLDGLEQAIDRAAAKGSRANG